MHVNINSYGPAGISMVDLLDNSTIIPFRYKELEKLLKIRIIPQGPFYITFSSTKIVSPGSIIMEFSKTQLKYNIFGDPSNANVFPESFLYEDINDFSVILQNTEINFERPGSTKKMGILGNFTNMMFIRFSSYNPAKWTVEEG